MKSSKYSNRVPIVKPVILDLYPEGFELDVYPGQKLIYTEPLLPEMDVDRVLEETEKIEKSLTASEKKRNKLNKKNLEIMI